VYCMWSRSRDPRGKVIITSYPSGQFEPCFINGIWMTPGDLSKDETEAATYSNNIDFAACLLCLICWSYSLCANVSSPHSDNMI